MKPVSYLGPLRALIKTQQDAGAPAASYPEANISAPIYLLVRALSASSSSISSASITESRRTCERPISP
jgi:hypothetical protein